MEGFILSIIIYIIMRPFNYVDWGNVIMRIQYIRTKDKLISYFGKLIWKNGDEFGFCPAGTTEVWWCKEDYWDLYDGELPFVRINVISK